MTLYRKIFLAIFLVSIALLTLSACGFYVFTLRDITNRHSAKYRAAAVTMAEVISKLEHTTEGHMRAALAALRYYNQSQPIPGNEFLATMAKDLSVSSIEVIQPDGQFIRSTSYQITELPNLFSLCGEYRQLFAGQKTFEHTPLMPSLVDGRVWKYSLLPSADGKYTFNVGMEVKFIDDLFRSLADDDKQLLGIGLFTPSGQHLGYLCRDQADFRCEHLVHGAPERDILKLQNWIQVTERVPATVSQCCECLTKGLTTEPGGGFYYVLRLAVSLDELRTSTQKMRMMLGTLLVLGLLLSYFLSRAIARRLYARIAEINAKTDELVFMKDLRQRIALSGVDEVARIGQKFDHLLEALEDAQKEILATEKARALGSIASQVAHDIRSPLAVLDVAMDSVQADLPEDIRSMLRNAIGRIRDIANDLRTEHSGAYQAIPKAVALEDSPAIHPLSSLVEQVVSEKRLQHSTKLKVEIEAQLGKEIYGVFVKVPATDFKRALSNLIDNAVESLPGTGKVVLRISTADGRALLTVTDTGKGIPEELLARIGERGFTHGKSSGSGLGFYQARCTVERQGGTLNIRSKMGIGTTVELWLPQAPPPPWFLPQLTLSHSMAVLVLDDDRGIHSTWEQLLAVYVQKGLELLHFTDAHLLHSWISEHRTRSFLGLIDYELLRQGTTGLDVIEREGMSDRVILVTSRHGEADVLSRAAKLNLKIIPKEMVGLVPIVYLPKVESAEPEPSPRTLRVLVIDDDEAIGWSWRKRQQRFGLAELRTFASMEMCEAAAISYESFDMAFIDVNIPGTSWPIDRTIRHLKSKGVKRVFVASGLLDAERDLLCREADGFITEKIPQDLRPFLLDPALSTKPDS